MQLDLIAMRDKIRDSQWALDDFDWDAPGRESVTENPELYARLKTFMADLMWIEHVGARGFAAMARKAPDDTLREIYTWFHAEEQRHANAEMALMRRWGMLDGDELPEPNINIRLVVEWLEAYADDMPLGALGSVIPMLEITLDGALCKFLLDTVEDPLCHEVFRSINADEARHLGVDFHVLEMLGYPPIYRQLLGWAGTMLDPRMMLGILSYLPLLNRMRDNIVALGLSEDRLYEAMRKYRRVGGTPQGRRNPWFQTISHHAAVVIDRRNWLYHLPMDALVRLTNHIPERLLPEAPSWVRELTWRPTA